MGGKLARLAANGFMGQHTFMAGGVGYLRVSVVVHSVAAEEITHRYVKWLSFISCWLAVIYL